jgi:hypothetical protein
MTMGPLVTNGLLFNVSWILIMASQHTRVAWLPPAGA